MRHGQADTRRADGRHRKLVPRPRGGWGGGSCGTDKRTHGQADERRTQKVSPPPQGGVGRGLVRHGQADTRTGRQKERLKVSPPAPGGGGAGGSCGTDKRTHGQADREGRRRVGSEGGGGWGGALFLGLLSSASVAGGQYWSGSA